MPFLLLWPAVMVCAWVGGQGPGLLATCLSASITACLFFEPPHWFSLTQPADWRGMALFLLLGGAISLLCEKLYRTREDLRRRAQELVEADEHKNQFLGMLAHELRNPLTPIQSAAEIIKQIGVHEPNLRWAADLIQRQVREAIRLVEDLLDVTRVSRGKVNLQKQRVELYPVVAQAVESSRSLIESRRHTLNLAISPEPIWLDADSTRLCQVVVNLLNNAAKYTDEGGDISLTLEHHGGEAIVRVKDNGNGITPELLPRVFELYTQGQVALAYPQGGLGIGLCLVRRLVEMHGGTVRAFSEGPSKGSEFIVRLPAVDSTPEWRPPGGADREIEGGRPPPPMSWQLSSRREVVQTDASFSSEPRHIGR
jgi:signal transduction histidine kinase